MASNVVKAVGGIAVIVLMSLGVTYASVTGIMPPVGANLVDYRVIMAIIVVGFLLMSVRMYNRNNDEVN